MKKLLLLCFVLSVMPVKAYAEGAPIAPPASVIQVHDMQMLQEQRFRHEEVDDNKDLNEEKARFWKKNRSTQEKIDDLKNEIQQKQIQVIQPSKRSEFIEENGQLKIKYY